VSPPLDRFKTAQDDPGSGFAAALEELRAGRKRSHWIWYVFPQLAGLGWSPMAVTYGLRDVDEAVAYLRDPLLRERLIAVTRAVADKTADAVPLADLMGSEIDARKLVSSMTLFGTLARRLSATDPNDDYATLATDADAILRAATRDGMPACGFTGERLRQTTSRRRF
jgi:uncharacterized protein (DUF1810 family)